MPFLTSATLPLFGPSLIDATRLWPAWFPTVMVLVVLAAVLVIVPQFGKLRRGYGPSSPPTAWLCPLRSRVGLTAPAVEPPNSTAALLRKSSPKILTVPL